MIKVVWNRHTVNGLAAIVLWSTTVGLVRSISEQIGPLTAGAAVYLTGGILSTGIYLIKKDIVSEIKKVSRFYLVGCGTLFIIYTTALFLSLGMAENRHQTLELGLINYLWPALTIIFSLFILSEKANLWLIPGTLLAIAGVYFVSANSLSFSGFEFIEHVGANPIAYSLAFIGAVSWALYSNLTRRTGNDNGIGTVPLFILVTGIVLLCVRLFYMESTVWNLRVVIEIVALGVSTALAYIFWDAAMRKGEMIFVVSFSYLTPFFSTLFSAIYLSVVPGINLWIGCSMIIAGSFISWRSIKLKST